MKKETTSADQSNEGGFELWYLISFFFGLLWPAMFYVLTQTYVLDVTGSAASAGLVLAIMGLGAVAAPVFGSLADRYRAHRPIQIFSLVLVIGGILIMGFAQDELFFTLAAIMVGVGLAPVSVINTVYVVAAGHSPEVEARVLGWVQRMTFAGVILGGFVIGGLLQLRAQGVVSYATLFVICAAAMGVALLLAIFATRDVAARVAKLAAQRAEQANQEAPPGKFSLGEMLKSTFGLGMLVIFLVHVGWIGMAGQYVNFLNGAFGVNPAVASSVNSVAVFLSLFVIGFTGKWLGGAGPVPVLTAGMVGRAIGALAMLAVGWLLGGAGGTAVALALLVWVALRLINPFTEMGNPVLAARTALGGAAQAQAVMIAIFALAITVGNILAGQLAERIGWLALPWQTIIFSILAFLVIWFGVRPRLAAGDNKPDPEMLMAERAVET
ncbi:MAG TPA: MFS transporter [Anaerolineae bacterium]|nr:MFS transporter [Anaerolineae bacterium]